MQSGYCFFYFLRCFLLFTTSGCHQILFVSKIWFCFFSFSYIHHPFVCPPTAFFLLSISFIIFWEAKSFYLLIILFYLWMMSFFAENIVVSKISCMGKISFSPIKFVVTLFHLVLLIVYCIFCTRNIFIVLFLSFFGLIMLMLGGLIVVAFGGSCGNIGTIIHMSSSAKISNWSDSKFFLLAYKHPQCIRAVVFFSWYYWSYWDHEAVVGMMARKGFLECMVMLLNPVDFLKWHITLQNELK